MFFEKSYKGAPDGAARCLGWCCSPLATGKQTTSQLLLFCFDTISDNNNTKNDHVQAEKRRQSGLPWILVTTLMMAAQLVGASLAATDFAEEYPVNITTGHFKSEE